MLLMERPKVGGKLLKFVHFHFAELVADFVVFNACMSLYPFPLNVQLVVKVVQSNPKVLVENGFLCGCLPSVLLPVLYPGSDSVFHVLAVAVYLDMAASPFRILYRCVKGIYGSAQFHAVVCRLFFSA